MIIEFTYAGTGIAQIKRGDKLKYDTERKPLPRDIIVCRKHGEMRVVRYHSRMRKRNDNYEFIGVVTTI